MAYEEVKVKKPLILRILPVASLVLFLVGWQTDRGPGNRPEQYAGFAHCRF